MGHVLVFLYRALLECIGDPKVENYPKVSDVHAKPCNRSSRSLKLCRHVSYILIYTALTGVLEALRRLQALQAKVEVQGQGCGEYWAKRKCCEEVKLVVIILNIITVLIIRVLLPLQLTMIITIAILYTHRLERASACQVIAYSGMVNAHAKREDS